MIIVAFVLGLIFGSFVNVLIYRLPNGISLFWPPSSCAVCKQRIRYRDNVPLLGYLLLRGKCSRCGTKISAIYPIVELLCALVFVTCFALYGFNLSLDISNVQVLINAVLESLVFCFLLALSFIDLKYFAVPPGLLLISLFLSSYLHFNAVKIALISMGFCVFIKAVVELLINMFNKSYEQIQPHSKPLSFDVQQPIVFNLILLSGVVITLVFDAISAVFSMGVLYVLLSLISVVFNKICLMAKLKREVASGQIRLYKEILGSADIELIGIIALIMNDYVATFASVVVAACIMLALHAISKICPVPLRPSAELAEYEVPKDALPFFPFLIMGMLIVLANPELTKVFGV